MRRVLRLLPAVLVAVSIVVLPYEYSRVRERNLRNFRVVQDGVLYRWDLASNRLAEQIRLNAPRPEAYTPTVIGPDGTVYAINNSTLYAVGRAHGRG